MIKDFRQAPPINSEAVFVGMATPKNRLAAFVLDLIIIVPFVRLLQSPFRRGMVDSALLEKTADLAQYEFLNTVTFLVVFMLYHSILIYWQGQTIGKIFFHIKVVSLTGQLTFITTLTRTFFMLLGLSLFAVPFLTLFSHPLRRALHDRISDTVVVGLKEYAGFPNDKEKLWATGLTVFALVFPVLILVFLVRVVSNPSLTNDFNLFEAESAQFLPCEFALKKGQTSMESAIELFLAERVTQDCLQDFAQESLWNNQDIELSKFAMALSVYEKAEKSNNYLRSICEESPEHHLCHFSLWLIDQESPKPGNSTSTPLQLLTAPDVENFIKVFAASYALQNNDFILVEKWLGLVSRQTRLQDRVSQLFFHSLLGQEQWDEARLVYRTHLNLQEDDLVAHLINHSNFQEWSVEKRLQILDFFSPAQKPVTSRMPASENNAESALEVYRQSLIEGL